MTPVLSLLRGFSDLPLCRRVVRCGTAACAIIFAAPSAASRDRTGEDQALKRALTEATTLSLRNQPDSTPDPESPAPETGADSTALDLPAAGSGSSSDLAKKLANPISDLISVPFQFNYDEAFGPEEASRYTLNIQPVIPFSLTEDLNLITRTIIPVIYQEAPVEGLDDEFGLGDVLQSFFISPRNEVGGWILGAGPVVLWPTGTTPAIRSESLSIGPTFVALRQRDGWTYGALVNHLWSVTESDDRESVNSTFLQPFVAYTWPTATTLTLNSETTYDWTAEEWTVPLNLSVTQVARIGGQPVSFQIGGRYYLDAPDGGPEWGIRFMVTLLFPR